MRKWFQARARSALVIGLLLLAAGCATRTSQPVAFSFGHDSFSFANELTWEYFHDEEGVWRSRRREPPPDYTLHCFPLIRACRGFFLNARFDPTSPPVCPEEYRRLVRRVMAANPRRSLPPDQKVIIPGYPDLHTFSEKNTELLKEECGSALQSYFQRGHWRMVLPFTKGQRERTAAQLLKGLELNWPPIVHIVVFPRLTVNHAVLVFDAESTPSRILFSIYDPNQPEAPAILEFDRQRKLFLMPATAYFPGGPVDVYEIFHRWNY